MPESHKSQMRRSSVDGASYFVIGGLYTRRYALRANERAPRPALVVTARRTPRMLTSATSAAERIKPPIRDRDVILRSPLFVPGNKANMIEKALGLKPDALVPDMEDSVPAAE